MPCRIYLRANQSASQRSLYSLPNRAKIFAPAWVKLGLTLLGQRLSGITFEVHESPSTGKPIETFTITSNFNNYSLNNLQKIARNEPSNVSGKINFNLYSDIKEQEVIFSIRDLVRQCVIVGVDECSNYGGYRMPHRIQPKQRVYICDLAALQFQQEYNTGRHVLIQSNPDSAKGILDDLIFEQMVGEAKRTYEEVLKLPDEEQRNRYILHNGFGKSCFFDTFAYKKFVENDVVLAGLAVSEMAFARGDEVEFKFLKYGTGFCAGPFQDELEDLILSGVVDGLERLFEMQDEKVKATIKKIGLPFFNQDAENVPKIHNLKEKYGLSFSFARTDALQFSKDDKPIVATTNCGDNHAACGNEMQFQSVDAAIAENIESKGNILCPNINTKIEEQYIDIYDNKSGGEICDDQLNLSRLDANFPPVSPDLSIGFSFEDIESNENKGSTLTCDHKDAQAESTDKCKETDVHKPSHFVKAKDSTDEKCTQSKF